MNSFYKMILFKSKNNNNNNTYYKLLQGTPIRIFTIQFKSKNQK